MKAAKAGSAESQYIFGCYKDSKKEKFQFEHIPKSDIAAFSWYKKSASKNFAQAQIALASLYKEGRGVKQDEARAKQILEPLAKNGNREAKKALLVKPTPSKLRDIKQNMHLTTPNNKIRVVG